MIKPRIEPFPRLAVRPAEAAAMLSVSLPQPWGFGVELAARNAAYRSRPLARASSLPPNHSATLTPTSSRCNNKSAGS